jgi:ring-1,2-phenylacetyl-CoA epoxidase subunit PaaA
MAATTPPEDEEALKRQVQNGRMIESTEEMTEGYEEALKPMLLVNADIEIMSVPHMFEQSMNAPNLDARAAEVSILQDEVGHAYISYRLLKNLGEDIDALVHDRDPGEWKAAYGFGMHLDNYAELTATHAFLDQAGLTLLHDIYEHTSYAPWHRALVKVEKEEQFHIRHGRTWFRRLASKNPDTKAKLQDAVDYLFPMSLEWFGLPDDLKHHSAQLEYNLKGKTNDELRQAWMDEVVPLCEENDVDVPAHYDEEAGEYVLEFDFPVAFDPERKEWFFDDPVTWDDVLDRWRAGAPAQEDFIEMIQTGELFEGVTPYMPGA